VREAQRRAGWLEEGYPFVVETLFKEDEVELAEAWVGYELAEDVRLMLGRMKEPFGLEEMLPSKGVDYWDQSLAGQFLPKEDHGLTVFGGTWTSPWQWGLAVYNGTGGEDMNSDSDVAGRLVWRPWADTPSLALDGFQVGLAATFGEQDADLAGEELRTETRVPFASFEPGSIADGERTRLGLELAWFHGPFALNAEAIRIEEDLAGAGGSLASETEVAYVSGSWVMTGEDKTERGVMQRFPDRPNGAGGGGGSGAWQLYGRLSRLDLDDGWVGAGLLAPTSDPDSVASLDLGVNWYATDHAVLRLHWIQTEYADDIVIDGDRRGSEGALVVQAQLSF
jgi:phosphate-selective porin OprO/OprP